VNALAITEAVHVVTPPRWSETVTTPSEPLIVLEVFETDCDPSDTVPVGALIDRPPAVNVNVVGVAARADIARRAATAASAATRTMKVRINRPFDGRRGPQAASPLHRRSARER
jgi:hypothetical protein